MTTTEVIVAADPGNQRDSDLTMATFLRDSAIPAYFHDLGYPFFTRDQLTVETTAGTAYVDLNVTNVRSIKHVGIQNGPTWPELKNIGEDSEAKLTALREIATGERAKPTGWWFSSSGSAWNRINLSCKPDQAYWLGVEWYRSIPWDGNSSLQLDQHIPPDMQYPLVLLCRAEIERARLGQGESRYPLTMQEYQMWIERIIWNLQKSAGNKARYVKR